MELKITRLFKTIEPKYYSASQAELGIHVGDITWQNSMSAAPRLLKSKTQLSEFKAYMQGFGAWSGTEISHWTQRECNALLLQLIAGDIRDSGLDTDNPNWIEYEAASTADKIQGNIFVSGTDVFYCIGG